MKMLIIGDSAVGKTNILLRFTEDYFTQSHLVTLGIDFKNKILDMDGQRIKLQIWDTAGHERYQTITEQYYKGAQGVILTYAINDRESFQHINRWMEQINLHGDQDVLKFIVGNKVDLENERVVYTDEGRKLAEKYNVKFFETSAAANINIKETFFTIAQALKDKFSLQIQQKNQYQQNQELSSRLHQTGDQNLANNKKCCS